MRQSGEFATEIDWETKARGFFRSPSVSYDGGRGKDYYAVPKRLQNLLAR